MERDHLRHLTDQSNRRLRRKDRKEVLEISSTGYGLVSASNESEEEYKS
ncbi:MAG TPA: hypothetical protein VEY51_14510 [Chondromyces sp.]|nr:hypothetical protein [Chondromyces sp.]